MSINNTCSTGEAWEPHAGLDYACVMLPGETTDTASISVHTDCPEERDRLLMLIAAVPAMLAALNDLVRATEADEAAEDGSERAWVREELGNARAALKKAEGR